MMDLKAEQVNIKFCVRLGKTVREIIEMLKNTFGVDTLHEVTIRQLPQSRRSSTAFPPPHQICKNIQSIVDRKNENLYRQQRTLFRETACCRK